MKDEYKTEREMPPAAAETAAGGRMGQPRTSSEADVIRHGTTQEQSCPTWGEVLKHAIWRLADAIPMAVLLWVTYLRR